jgi:hypothetical protein
MSAILFAGPVPIQGSREAQSNRAIECGRVVAKRSANSSRRTVDESDGGPTALRAAKAGSTACVRAKCLRRFQGGFGRHVFDNSVV